MGDISKNFSYSEFSASSVAKANGIDNTLPKSAKPAIRALVIDVLQPICDAKGWNCDISSGYRSKELNEHKDVGGVESSQHRKGEAADTKFFKRENEKKVYIESIEVLRVANDMALPFDQMIAYPTFVHFSHKLRGVDRKQILYNKSYKGERL